MKIQAVIPARLHSTRLPEKLIRDLAGKSVLRRVYENALSFNIFDKIIIATDSDIIKQHALEFTEDILLTSSDHESGTSRISEVADNIDADIIVNIQGDEPFLKARPIQGLINLLRESDSMIATLAYPSNDKDEAFSKSSVKIVRSHSGKALYFSRLPIPAVRDEDQALPEWLIHIGIYAFKKEFFSRYRTFNPSLLEKHEKLEQLSFMENDLDIAVALTDEPTVGIDTLEDLQKAILKY